MIECSVLEGPAIKDLDRRSQWRRLDALGWVTCPFCLAVWGGRRPRVLRPLRPRATRFAASILAAVTGADLLHLAYTLEQKSQA